MEPEGAAGPPEDADDTGPPEDADDTGPPEEADDTGPPEEADTGPLEEADQHQQAADVNQQVNINQQAAINPQQAYAEPPPAAVQQVSIDHHSRPEMERAAPSYVPFHEESSREDGRGQQHQPNSVTLRTLRPLMMKRNPVRLHMAL